VLLSQRTTNWREQVGLPIVEALAHGCAVVASDETGLADWLATHGHRCVSPSASEGELADVVVVAIKAERPVDSVLADLPAVDGRSRADAWLFGRKPGHDPSDGLSARLLGSGL